MRTSVENGGTLNSDTAKEALGWYVDMLQYAPPGVRTYTWDEAAAVFGTGIIAQGFLYMENLGWLAHDPDRSVVIGKVAIDIPPAKPGVMEAAEAGEGYIGYYDGGAWGIPYCSKNKKLLGFSSSGVLVKNGSQSLLISYFCGKEICL